MYVQCPLYLQDQEVFLSRKHQVIRVEMAYIQKLIRGLNMLWLLLNKLPVPVGSIYICSKCAEFVASQMPQHCSPLKSLLECHHAKGTSPCTMLSYYYSSKWSIILRPSSWTNRSNQHATIRTPGIMLVAVAKRRCQIPQIITLDSIFAGLKYRCNFSLFSRYGNVSAFRWVNVIALGSTVTYW